MRIKYEKALNSEMMLKMELEEKLHVDNADETCIPCLAPCSQRNAAELQEDGCCMVPVPDPNETAQTTTFYTELTIRVFKKLFYLVMDF